MWQSLYQQSFLIGAVLVLIYQTAKFSELNLGDPVTRRYFALLPGAQVRDFAGPYAYHFALAAFLLVSLVVYFLFCNISPTLLAGAAKLLGGADAEKLVQEIPYPLYIAALFMGLTQPIIPGLSQFEAAQRDFFHNQIDVPRRIIDLSEALTSAIEARAGSDRERLAAEVQKLSSADFMESLLPYGDLAFYKLQLENLEIGNGALDGVIKDSSAKELRKLIERLVLSALVAVMRKSGPNSLIKVAERLDVHSPTVAHRNFVTLIVSLIPSGMLFFIGCLVIAHALYWLGGPIEGLFGKSADHSLWPSSLDFAERAVLTIAIPIISCLFAALWLVGARPRDQGSDPGFAPPASLIDDLVNFIRSNPQVLVLCILISVVLNVGQMFYEYGTFHLPPEARSVSRLTLPVIQSFIAVAVCLVATWHLAPAAPGAAHRGLSFGGTALIIAVTAGSIALLSDLTFMDQYLAVHPGDYPGGDHVLFSVLANVLVSVCAFASVAVFFGTRRKLGSVNPPQAIVHEGDLKEQAASAPSAG